VSLEFVCTLSTKTFDVRQAGPPHFFFVEVVVGISLVVVVVAGGLHIVVSGAFVDVGPVEFDTDNIH